MERIELRADAIAADVDHALGAGLASLRVRTPAGPWADVLRPAPPRTTWFNDLACYVLAPWSNRIRGGRFRFRGREVTLRPDWPDGTAIHGAVKDRPFRILDRAPMSARLRLESAEHAAINWPWPFACEVRYELRPGVLRADLRLHNRADEPVPAGLGFHPYFAAGPAAFGPVSTAVLTGGRYPCEHMLPTGPARADDLSRSLAAGLAPIGTPMDDAFAPPPPGAPPARVAWAGPDHTLVATLAASPDLGHRVIFSRGTLLCVEPVSMVNDGFNLADAGMQGTGVRVLAPGEHWDAWWELRVAWEPRA